jgi:hypothetical protein
MLRASERRMLRPHFTIAELVTRASLGAIIEPWILGAYSMLLMISSRLTDSKSLPSSGKMDGKMSAACREDISMV